MFLKHDFFMFWGILGTFHFSFFGLRGGENFWTCREGGAKNFGRVAKGGRKILDRQLFWNPKGSMNMLLKNESKIRRFARVIAIYVISPPP